MTPTNDKQAKHNARKVQQHAAEAMEAGDYATAGEQLRQVVKEAGDSDEGRAAAADLDNLRLDPWAVRAGVIAVVLVMLGWSLSL